MESGQNIALFAENEPFRATKMWNELVRNFKTGVRLKKKRWRMKYYHDCFSGSDVLAWIHHFLKLNPNFNQNVSRSQAKLLCQKLLQRNVFEDVVEQFKLTKPAFEEHHLYCFVGKKRGKEQAEAKENENSLPPKSQMSSTKKQSTLKRRSSFSDRFQLTRKPLGDRKGLQNISNEMNNKLDDIDKPSQTSLRHDINNEKRGKTEKMHSKPRQSNARLKGKHSEKNISGLTRIWKSEFDISLLEKVEPRCDQDLKNDSGGRTSTDQKGLSNDNTQTTSGEQVVCHNIPDNIKQKTVGDGCQSRSQETSSGNQKRTADNHKEECHLQTDPNELWLTVCLERLQLLLNVNDLNDILDVELSSWKNIMENITCDLRSVTEAVPKWLVSAMKCLIHWPQSVEAHAAEYSGFETDVFKTIREHFELLSEPLVSTNFIKVFTKISGVITKCKLSGIRALQLILVILKKDKRQLLQLLLRFMIKISNNHQLHLSSHLPTRELVIQTFVPCIFGEETSVHEILGIRITSFLMENYSEIFKVPDGLNFEVEQRIAFRNGKRKKLYQDGEQSNDIAFCLRVTKQEYEEQKQFGTQRFLEDLLESIVHDEKINEKERKKKLKLFQKTYPEIYFSRYPTDDLSMISQQPAKLRRVMKPLIRRNVKDFR